MANGTATNTTSGRREGFFGKVGRFLKEAWIETVHKASWPTLPELRSFTIVVIFAVLVVAAYIGVLDWFFGWFVDRIK